MYTCTVAVSALMSVFTGSGLGFLPALVAEKQAIGYKWQFLTGQMSFMSPSTQCQSTKETQYMLACA